MGEGGKAVSNKKSKGVNWNGSFSLAGLGLSLIGWAVTREEKEPFFLLLR